MKIDPDTQDILIETFNLKTEFHNIQVNSRGENGGSTTIHMSGAPIIGPAGNFLGFRGAISDTTVKTEEKNNAQAKQRAIVSAIDNAQEAIVLWDADEKFVLSNRAFQNGPMSATKILKPGLSYQEYLKYIGPESDLTHPSLWLEEELRTLRDSPVSFERTRNGQTIFIRNQRLEDGSIISFQSDVTESRGRDKAQRQTQKMELIGQMAAGLAHDFNNLMSSVLGNIELIRFSGVGDAQTADNLDRAKISVHKAAELTRRLLAFSRKQTLKPEPTELQEIIDSLCEILERTLDERITIVNSSTGQLWPIAIDPQELDTALMNLTINSRNAMPAGGELKFDSANVVITENDLDDSKELQPGEYVRLTVSDCGRGITKAELPHVFEPYFTTNQFGESSGLGLSMVYGFINQSGGFIDIESTVGVGTKVSLYLPRLRTTGQWPSDQQQPLDPESAIDDLSLLGNKELILVIEDDPDVRQIALETLERFGYRTLDGGDGHAISKLIEKSEKIDLLLSDVVLPNGRSGSDIADRVQKQCVDTKVLLMTGYANYANEANDFDYSKYPIIKKPFPAIELARKVQSVIHQQR